MNPAASRPSSSWRGYALVWTVLGTGLLVTLFAALWLAEEACRTDAARFAALVEQTRQDFDNITEKYQQALHRLADAIGAREDFSERDWNLQIYWLSPDVDFPGLAEIQLVRVAIATNLPPELETLDADQLQPGEVEELAQFKKANRILARARLRVQPLWSYIARHATEPHGVGEPGSPIAKQEAVFKLAVHSQTVRMTGRRVMLTYPDGREILGTTMLIPVPDKSLTRAWSTNFLKLHREAEGDTYHTAKVYAALRGASTFVCGSIDWQSLLKALMGEVRPELHFDLYAYTKPRTNRWLAGSAQIPAASQVLRRASFSTNSLLNVYSGKWTMALHTTPHFDRQSTGYRAYVALLGGTVVTLLMAGLLATQVRARLRQQSIAGELRQSLQDLEAARTERDQLGRDLHDGAIQSLYALQLGLSRTATHAKEFTPAIAERLAEYRRSVSGIIGELRRFILRHEAETQSGADLCRVLDATVNRLRPTTAAELTAQLESASAARLSNEQAVHLANIAREALSNSLRHGSPARVQLALGSENGSVKLEIADDGCGFDPAGLPSSGMGLANMTARAQEAGGELKVDSARGRGTRIVVRVAAKESPSS